MFGKKRNKRKKSGQPKRNRFNRLLAEQLESRRVLAGNVSAFINGGTLHINGDLDDNDISLVAGFNDGLFTITPNGTTTLNGVGFAQSFQSSADLRISMGDGNDNVAIDGLGGFLPRDLIFAGGTGDDSLTVLDYSVGRRVLAQGEDGNDDINLIDVSGRDANLTGGSGNNSILVGDFFFGSSFDRNVNIVNGDGNNVVTVTDSTINRSVNIRNGNGNNEVNVTSVEGFMTIGLDLIINNGNGSNLVNLNQASIADDLTIRNGDGTNDVIFESASIIDDVYVTNGDGTNTIDWSNSTMEDAVTISNGDGTNSITFDFVRISDNLTQDSNNLSISNGDGDSTLTFLTAIVGGRTDIDNGDSVAGGHNITIDSGSTLLGDVSIRNGNADTNVNLTGSTFGSNVTVLNQAGNHALFTGLSGVVGIQGNLSIYNGDGDTLTDIDQATTIGGGLVITNQEGLDEIQIGDGGFVSIGLDVQIRNNSGGSITTINDAAIGRDLNIRTRSGIDTVTIDGATTGDDLFVDTGNDADTITIDNSNFTDDVRVASGMGDDTVTFGAGSAPITADNLSLDGGTEDLADLLVVDGGFNPTTPAVALKIRGFEAVQFTLP